MPHMQRLCRRRLHEELKAGGESPVLSRQVAACVGKALHMLAEKAEYMAASGTLTSDTPGSSRS